MAIARRDLRKYLAAVAQQYAEDSGDRSLRADIMSDFDRMLNGETPVNPFYAWDALGVLRNLVIPESDVDGLIAANDLYLLAEKHFMEEAALCRPTSINEKTDPPLR